jgi:hypothetical protein
MGAVMDILGVITTYPLLFASHLYATLPRTIFNKKAVSSIIFVAAFGTDLLETATHLVAVTDYPHRVPSDAWIRVVSMVTQLKLVTILVSLLLTLALWLLPPNTNNKRE